MCIQQFLHFWLNVNEIHVLMNSRKEARKIKRDLYISASLFFLSSFFSSGRDGNKTLVRGFLDVMKHVCWWWFKRRSRVSEEKIPQSSFQSNAFSPKKKVIILQSLMSLDTASKKNHFRSFQLIMNDMWLLKLFFSR